jgi:hypothetical protein
MNSPFHLCQFDQFFPFCTVLMPTPGISASVDRGVLFTHQGFCENTALHDEDPKDQQ